LSPVLAFWETLLFIFALLFCDGDTLVFELTDIELLELAPFPDTVIVAAAKEGTEAVKKIPSAKAELNNLTLI
jgi:hypothetical protein